MIFPLLWLFAWLGKEEDNAALASDATNSQTEFLYDDVFEEPVSETNPDSEYINDNVTFTLPTNETEVQFDDTDVSISLKPNRLKQVLCPLLLCLYTKLVMVGT